MARERTEAIDIPRLGLLIESKLRLVVPRSHFLVKSSWYLAQLYIAAREYRMVVRKMATSPSGSANALFNEMTLTREIAKTFSFYAVSLGRVYEMLDDYVRDGADNEEGKKTSKATLGDPPTSSHGDLAGLHRKYYERLRRRLRRTGCTEATSATFANDALHLLWETDLFVRRVASLITREGKDRSGLGALFAEIARPWIPLHGHAIYHLGSWDDEDASLYNPGVLEWSLVVLAEIGHIGEKKASNRRSNLDHGS